MVNAQRGLCYYCGCVLDVTKTVDVRVPTIEHKIPLSRGGTWTVKNLVAACYGCNHLKGSGVIPPAIAEDRALLRELFQSKEIKKYLQYPSVS